MLMQHPAEGWCGWFCVPAGSGHVLQALQGSYTLTGYAKVWGSVWFLQLTCTILHLKKVHGYLQLRRIRCPVKLPWCSWLVVSRCAWLESGRYPKVGMRWGWVGMSEAVLAWELTAGGETHSICMATNKWLKHCEQLRCPLVKLSSLNLLSVIGLFKSALAVLGFRVLDRSSVFPPCLITFSVLFRTPGSYMPCCYKLPFFLKLWSSSGGMEVCNLSAKFSFKFQLGLCSYMLLVML